MYAYNTVVYDILKAEFSIKVKKNPNYRKQNFIAIKLFALNFVLTISISECRKPKPMRRWTLKPNKSIFPALVTSMVRKTCIHESIIVILGRNIGLFEKITCEN